MKYELFDKIIMRNPLNSIDDVNIDMDEYNNLFIEGVYISSPDYWELVTKHIDSISYKKSVLSAFKKFWIRSCTRCAPYGTFAGSTLLNVSSKTNILLNGQNDFKKHLKLDMNVLASLIETFKNIPQIKDHQIYKTNNSLYLSGDKLRFIQYSYHSFNRHYYLSTTYNTPFLAAILLEAKDGKTINYLIEFAKSSFGIDHVKSEEYINNLVESQLLLSSIELTVTGEDPLQNLIKFIRNLKDVEYIIKPLEDIRDMIIDINNSKYNEASLKLLENRINNIGLSFKTPSIKFQIDLYITTKENSIDKNILRMINQQTERLETLGLDAESNDFKKFKSRFFKLYGNNYEVPLNTALDPDHGIGYSYLIEKNFGNMDLIQNVYGTIDDNKSDIKLSYLDKLIASKLCNYFNSSSSSIEINDEDINFVNKNDLLRKKNYSIGKFILGSLLKKDGVLKTNNFNFLLKEIGTNSASTLLGRFAVGNDEIMKFVSEVINKEDEFTLDVIHAEIIHLPNNRIGNIIFRPVLRKYEIPYVTHAETSKEFEIPLEDLSISFQNGEIILRSKKFNKRIIPHLSNAHNFYKGEDLPLYKFLCDLQLQGKYSFEWNWGLFTDEKFLPRVMYKNIIIKAARWRVTKDEVEIIISDNSTFYTHIELWRNKREIPCNVNIIYSNSFIFIDFSSQELTELFLQVLYKEKIIFIEESYCTADYSFVKNIHGKYYANELIIPLVLSRDFDLGLEKSFQSNSNSVKRKYLPNDDWVYFKIFAGNKIIEEILVFKILPYVQKNINKTFDKFFFVRYFDDEPTLRLRFFCANGNNNLIKEDILLLLKSDFENLLIKNIQLDTYNRELERYGDLTIVDAESIFFIDSLSALKLLSILQFNEDKYRWLTAMRSIDNFIESFSLNLEHKINFMQKLKNLFEFENINNTDIIKNINMQYRIYENFIETHMNSSLDHINGISEVNDILYERSLTSRSIIKSVVDNYKSPDLDKLIVSFIHMSLNRLFISEPRKCELIVYHFLYKYYKVLFFKLRSNKVDNI